MNKIKNLFATPGKAILTSFCVVAAIAVIGTGSVFAAKSLAESQAIGKVSAESAALADAGIDPAAVTTKKAEFERENGQYVYEVEFYADGVEYEYLVDAKSGTVISKQAKTPTGSVPIGGQTVTEPQTPNTSPEAGATATHIGIDAARQVALADAGVSAADVTFTKGHLDYDDGVQVYDIEFYTATAEYDYEINAATGAIVDKSVETVRSEQRPTPEVSSQPAPTPPASSQPAPATQIGLDAARQIALADAGVSAADVTFTKGHLDYDDGVQVYDIEFYTATAEYDYEINAATGAIVDKSVETVRNEQPPTPEVSSQPAPSGYIGIDRAKDIALAHAKLSISNVTFQKAKLENDDGRVEYEIEFYANRVEYEYTIDATTGNILDYDVDYDD